MLLLVTYVIPVPFQHLDDEHLSYGSNCQIIVCTPHTVIALPTAQAETKVQLHNHIYFLDNHDQ
jgi:hypothetical protein